MSANAAGSDEKLQEIRRRFEEDADFRSAAESDLEGTLRKAGLPDELVSRFAPSDTDVDGNTGMGLRTERWICIYEGETKVQCWCTSCTNY